MAWTSLILSFAPDHLKNGVELQEGYRMVMGFNEPGMSYANLRTGALTLRSWRRSSGIQMLS